eukprot:GFUD01040802.1.p1 GENE.GFUD01040802.1~~GFUD01040802.1.p1  ORF type:complete len:321 (-),score=104.77 GFUD01040802.1:296-1258(-)
MPGVAKSALQGDLSMPTEWKAVGEVDKLFVFPVKSLAHVEVENFNTGPFAAESGFMVDRQFMVVDKKDKFTTSRKFPSMSLIQPEVTQTHLTLKYPGMEDISVKIPAVETLEGCKEYEIFGDPCKGFDVGPEVGEWLSDVILNDPEGGMRLLYHPKVDSTRPDKPTNEEIAPNMKPGDKPYFADTFAYMMMSQPSIDELNKLLGEEDVDLVVEEKRFRPNIFINGEFPAFSEDEWAYIKVGEVIFRNSRACDRCVFTTVDPFMGDKHPQGEPLKTLRKYRCAEDPAEKKAYGSAPLFGVFLAVEKCGNIKVGDKVCIGKH